MAVPDPGLLEVTLRQAARDAACRAYAPYSGFAVGAAVAGASGRVFAGANVENASYGLTICAERAAVAQAIAAGERRLAACATHTERGSSAPCGACRQVLAEFLAPDAAVYYVVEGSEAASTIGALLPAVFRLAEG